MSDAARFFRNALIFGGLFIVGYAPVLYFNVVIDPDGVFRTDFSTQPVMPNMRFIKMRYILAHPDQFDSFAFGSSRTDAVDASRIPDGKWYNFFTQGGYPKEHLEDIEYLLANGVRIRNILIGVDDVSYTTDPKSRAGNMSVRPYRRGLDAFRYYRDEILHVPTWFYVKTVLDPKERYEYDIEGSGRYLDVQAERFIEEHPDIHVKDTEKFPIEKGWLVHNTYRIDETIQDLRRIMELCRANGIRLTVFVNPMHESVYRELDTERYTDFLRKLSTVTEFYDFSGMNEVTTDALLYYGNSHYRPIVGDAMLRVMFGTTSTLDVKDFGVLVTPANADDHAARILREFPTSTRPAAP